MRDYRQNVTGNQYADRRQGRTLGAIDTDQFLFHLREIGYNCIQTKDRNRGCGDWICIPPVGRKGYYVIRQVSADYNSSKHLVIRCARLSYEEAEVLRNAYDERNVG